MGTLLTGPAGQTGQRRAPAPPAALALEPSPIPGMLAAMAVLLCLGLVMIFSTSWIGLKGELQDPTYFFRKQVTWICLSSLGFILAWGTDYRTVARYLPWGLGLLAVALILVFVPPIGQEIRRVHRWIRLGGIQIQPSEMAKFILPWAIAARLAQVQDGKPQLLRDTIPCLALVGFFCALIAVEPDFGTALFVGGCSLMVLFVGGVPIRHLVALAVPPLVAGSLFMASRFGHVMARIEAFLEPEKHIEGSGYQVYQSLIALGSGGLTGKGLGASTQKMLYLPDAHTDFIFAVLGEELGLLGTLFVVGIFTAILMLGARILGQCRDRLGFLMGFSVIFAFCLQAAVNMAVVTGSVPNKGISMPLVSFGGSSLFFSLTSLGVLLNIAHGARREQRLRMREVGTGGG